MAKLSVKEFLKRKNISITVQTYLIDALGAMAFGLFASLLIGIIFGTLSRQLRIGILDVIADYAKSATGAALGIAIAHALKAPQLVLFSAAAVGIASSALDGPVGTLVATIVVAGLGKIIFGGTRLDIIVTPDITIISGVLVAWFVEPGVAQSMNWFGNLVKTATKIQSPIMGILVSILTDIALTLPISSAAIYTALSPNGLAGDAATAGRCAQMTGFVVMSYHGGKVGGLMAQGLDTNMLRMGNIVLNPRIQILLTLASVITGPIITTVSHLKNTPAGTGMDTCDLVGLIGIHMAMGGGTQMWVGILLVCFLFPGVLTFVFGEALRKMG